MYMPFAWDIGSFLTNSTNTLTTWFSALTTIIGLIMLIWSIVKIAQALISHGKTQTSWPVNIALLLIGGALALGGGFAWVRNIGAGGKQTIDDLGQAKPAAGGTILPMLFEVW